MIRLVLFCSVFLAGCATKFPQAPEDAQSGAANQLLDAAIEAHGGYLFGRDAKVIVEYDGRWRQIVKALQPVLVDKDYRKTSIETLSLDSGGLEQIHRGPGGVKRVLRTSRAISVEYDGDLSEDPEVRDAAALVADAYTLFLAGPSYIRFRDGDLALLEPATFKGELHDRIHAVLRPGFGFSNEDRVVLWIDRETRRLRLVHFTIDGMASTRGAHVDVEFERLSGSRRIPVADRLLRTRPRIGAGGRAQLADTVSHVDGRLARRT